jgi:olfactory receptor
VSVTSWLWAPGWEEPSTHFSKQVPNSYCHSVAQIPAIFHLACVDTTINELVTLVDIGFLALTYFILIINSYGYIVAGILRIWSSDGCSNAFSTCAAHFTVVIVYYVPWTIKYVQANAMRLNFTTVFPKT